MDAIPPADVPDPASPTPATPAPKAGQGSPRIRSVPPPRTRAARLPGTYAAHSGGEDMNWRRGISVLWTLFALTVGLEFLRAAFQLLAGYTVWPSDRDVIRVGASALAFLLLWLGWDWARWVLVVVDFLAGMYLFVWGVAGQMGPTSPGAQAMREASPLVGTVPSVGLGLVYLGMAGFAAFSADLLDFTRHRREAGRVWVLGPVLGVLGVYMAVLFTLELPYEAWIKTRAVRARTFGDEVVHRMAARWDPHSIDGLGDARFESAWTLDFKQTAFGSLAPLGPLEKADQVELVPLATTFDLASGGFIMQYSYNLRQARFAHGTADVGLFVVKPLFGPWEINDLVISQIQVDPQASGEGAR